MRSAFVPCLIWTCFFSHSSVICDTSRGINQWKRQIDNAPLACVHIYCHLCAHVLFLVHAVRADVWMSDRALSALLFTVDWAWGRVRWQHGWPSLITRHRQSPVLRASIQSHVHACTHTYTLINPKTEGKLKKKAASTFNWTDCHPTIKRKQAQSFASILSLVELLIDGANCTRKWNGEEKHWARVCLNASDKIWLFMCDACCVDSCIRVRRSIEFLHGDCREPVCARQASWYLVVQVHNAPAEKRKKGENNWSTWGRRHFSLFSHVWTTVWMHLVPKPTSTHCLSDPSAFWSTSSETHRAALKL